MGRAWKVIGGYGQCWGGVVGTGLEGAVTDRNSFRY